MRQRNRLQNLLIIPITTYMILYAIFSASFLTQFPFVHSDEAWLAGLTRDMQAGRSFGVTEHFFDLKPRVPHALKLLFHALQMGYIQLFGYNVQTVRLLSLTAGLVCLWLVYLIGKNLAGKWTGAGLMVLVSLDIQFIYCSHFGRQEILLCASMLSCVLILLRCQGQPSPRQALYMALITGVSVGIHPNSFLNATVCGSVMAGSLLYGKMNGSALHRHLDRKSMKPLAIYICVTGAVAALFVGISFLFDPNFIPNYFRYGEREFDLSFTAGGRLSEFLYFFKSIYARESGTYYIPDLRLELILLPVILVLLMLAWLFLRNSQDGESCSWCRRTLVLLLSMVGLTVGMIIIGRYNQTSIIFFLLLEWICAAQFVLLFERPGRILAAASALVFLLWNGYTQILPTLNAPSYSLYLEQLSGLIPKDANVIANLNTEFYFEQGNLRDYRNLPYLDSMQALEQYIEENKIQYIFLTDELDYIYENRPYYNVIYGNADFIKDLKTYCETRCTVSGTFENPQYAARIISLLNHSEYSTVTIYKVVYPSSLSLSPVSNPSSPL